MNAPAVPGLEELRDLLALAPFHRWLGLSIAEVGANELVISMPWRDEIISNPTVGAAHGGIVSALIDLTGLYTIIAMGGAARATADLHVDFHRPAKLGPLRAIGSRSEEHTSEIQSLMRISYAVFCLKKKTTIIIS